MQQSHSSRTQPRSAEPRQATDAWAAINGVVCYAARANPQTHPGRPMHDTGMHPDGRVHTHACTCTHRHPLPSTFSNTGTSLPTERLMGTSVRVKLCTSHLHLWEALSCCQWSVSECTVFDPKVFYRLQAEQPLTPLWQGFSRAFSEQL